MKYSIKDKDTLSSNIIGFLIWLLWVSVVVLILGGAIYLFVGGSTLFAHENQLPIVAYRRVSDEQVALTGSILLPSQCHRLKLSTSGNDESQTLNFNFIRIDDCDADVLDAIPETFSVEFTGSESTAVRATVGGSSRELVIK